MKRKGFTLIELLAVIVVLAIIALIATPIVMNTIKNAKKGAAERSADNYIKQVETAVAEERLNKNEVLEGEYQITSDGNLCRDKSASCSDDNKIKIEMSGTKPTSGKIKITNGSVDQSSSSMTVGDYTVSYNSTKKTYEATEKGSSTTTALCTANTSKVSALVWAGNNDPGQESSYTRQKVGLLASESGAYTPGVTYTCELGDGESNTFYVLEENGDNVSLIAGFNLGDTVAWSEDGSNHKDEDVSKQAVTAKAALKERTSGWTRLTESQISLPTASQIATASGKIINDNGASISGLSTWLYSYTKTPVAYGYWTSTPFASRSNSAWYVFCDGSLNHNNVDHDDVYGVRPVITVLKTNLS